MVLDNDVGRLRTTVIRLNMYSFAYASVEYDTCLYIALRQGQARRAD